MDGADYQHLAYTDPGRTCNSQDAISFRSRTAGRKKARRSLRGAAGGGAAESPESSPEVMEAEYELVQQCECFQVFQKVDSEENLVGD